MIRRDKFSFKLALLLALVFSVATISSCMAEDKPVKAPLFKSTTVGGEDFDLKDLRGKVVALDFWATWCPPCKAAVPHLMEMQEEYGDEGLVVGVSLDNQRPAVQKFMDKFDVNYTILMGPKSAKAEYQVSSIPKLFVIDRDGYIVGQFTGYDKRIGEDIEERIKEVLKAE